jgi:hypothetical protein
MGNRIHASKIAGSVSVLLLISALAFMLPSTTHAASLTDQVKKRLCDRQDRLAGRLARALINPSLCGSSEPSQPTLSFTANPSEIEEGESSTLSWSTTNASSCTASNGWSGSKNTSGSESVSPDEDTTYTLTCTGTGGSVSKSVTVSVDDEQLPTPTLDFDADPTSVAQFGTTTLTWDSNNATSCIASNGWSGTKSLDSSQAVALSATTTFTLACGNGVSTSTESVTVNVSSQPAPSVEISADPMTITEGDSSELSWESDNVTSCTASNGWSGSKDLDGTATVTPSVTTTYAIECTGPGGTAQDSVTVTVNDAQESPEVNLSANPTTVTPGEGSATSTLTWTTSDADLCLASGGWSGSKALNGNEIVTPTATTTYTLECSNEAGTSTDSVTVNFVPEDEPEPSLDHLVISEVYYDVASTTAGSESNNEWIEVYNGTGSAINLQGWSTGTLSASSSVIANSVVIESGAYAVIAASTTPDGIPGGVAVIVLNSAINGGGLANGGDAVFLRNASNEVVDAVSWGSNTDAFNPSVSVVADGNSIIRSSVVSDTNAASDWMGDTTPSPGQAN